MVEPAVKAHGLVHIFGPEAGLRGVDLEVAHGQIHALVGLNGAGKSTLMRVILGMLNPGAGAVSIAGRTAGRIDWTHVGHLVERPYAYAELTVRANLRLAAQLRGVPAAQDPRMAEAILEELNLARYAGIRAGKLSQGNLQRLGLATALQHDPRVIVLDEPTNSLDPRGVILLRESLLERAGRGAGILVSSHHLDEVARIANRISVLHAGRIIGTLDPHGIDIERAFFDLVLAADEESG